MLAKCVNPSCTNSFKHLREGRLLRVEKSSSERLPLEGRKHSGSVRSNEYFWLCGPCSLSFNLAFDKSGILLIPLTNAPADQSSPLLPAHRRTASVA